MWARLLQRLRFLCLKGSGHSLADAVVVLFIMIVLTRQVGGALRLCIGLMVIRKFLKIIYHFNFRCILIDQFSFNLYILDVLLSLINTSFRTIRTKNFIEIHIRSPDFSLFRSRFSILMNIMDPAYRLISFILIELLLRIIIFNLISLTLPLRYSFEILT